MKSWRLAFALICACVGLPAFAQTTLTASPSSGNAPLQTTLTWSSPTGSVCTASGAWSGSKAAAGSQQVTISTASTFNLSCIAPVTDGTAQLSWTAPTQNTDDSPLTDLAGFRVYRGSSPTTVNQAVVQIDNAGINTYTVSGLATGTHYFAVTALNSTGQESPQSNIGQKTIGQGVPSTASTVVLVNTVPKAPVLTVIETTAYKIKKRKGQWQLAKAAGTVPVGTVCTADASLPAGYARVDYRVMKGRGWRPVAVVARCA